MNQTVIPSPGRLMTLKRDYVFSGLLLLFLCRVTLSAPPENPLPLQEEALPTKKIDIKDIITAWQKREIAIESFRFEAQERYTAAKGGILSKGHAKNPTPDPIPSMDTVFDCSFALAMSKNKMRCSKTRPALSSEGKLTLDQYSAVVSNGAVNKSYDKAGTAAYDRGWVGDEPIHPDYRENPVILPLLLMYRPFGVCDLERAMHDSHINSRLTLINGVSCISVHFSKYTFWVDPRRQFLIARCTEGSSGKVGRQVDYSEYRNTNGIWVVAGWRNTLLSPLDGGVKESADVRITNYSINEPIEDREFELDFPPGTYVRDRRQPPSLYIVRANGGKRIVTQAERGASYEQLVNTESGEALSYRKGNSWAGWLGLLAVIMVVGCAVAWRRLRKVFYGVLFRTRS